MSEYPANVTRAGSLTTSDTSINSINNREVDFLELLKQSQNNYYEQSGKNVLFKKAQKMDCAVAISNSCDIETLLNHSIYIIPNTNKVFMDYAIFKMYANPQNYLYVVNKILYLFNKCINEYGVYDVHINLASLTMSGCERHKSIFSLIMTESLNGATEYATILNKFHIYNPPSVMDTVFRLARPFMNPIIMQKVVLYTKMDSEQHMKNLFS